MPRVFLAFAVLCTVECSLVWSKTLGDHMVLQRDAVSPPASVWGLGAAPGDTVDVVFNGASIVAAVNESTGVWIAALPPTPAGGPYTIVANSSDGSSLQMVDVLFGDVFFFGGQSNMAFTVSEAYNATTEIESANSYPMIVSHSQS